VIINKEALEAVKKAIKARAPETMDGALGYLAFMAPFERLPDEAKARIMVEVQKAANKRARKIYEEES
jgi:hypothetical protein